MSRTPERTAGVLLTASLLGVVYADFHSYVLTFYANPDAWGTLLRGGGNAPEQYRVGIIQLAAFLSRHSALRIDHAFTLIDLASLLIAGFLLLRQLIGVPWYRAQPRPQRWFALAGLLFLLQFYLAWLLSPQRPETLPATLLVVLTAAVLAPAGRTGSGHPPAAVQPASARSRSWGFARGLTLLLIAALGCTFRADVVFALGAGLVATSLTRRPGLTLSRIPGAAAGATMAALAIAAHLYLARVVYPAATYGRVKLWQLRPNFIHPERWIPFLLFMLPLLWTARQATRQPWRTSGAQRVLLLSAAIYFVLWITVGKLDEVRIMLPFALALAPLTMELAMRQLDATTETDADATPPLSMDPAGSIGAGPRPGRLPA